MSVEVKEVVHIIGSYRKQEGHKNTFTAYQNSLIQNVIDILSAYLQTTVSVLTAYPCTGYPGSDKPGTMLDFASQCTGAQGVHENQLRQGCDTKVTECDSGVRPLCYALSKKL